MTFLAEIETEPYRFDFLDVLRHLERAFPEKPRIGDSGARDEELVILGQTPYVDFPASNLFSFEQNKPDNFRILSKFLGMLGPQGALPMHTTYEAKHWIDMRDPSFARFMDIFNHRFQQLFYRAWADARPVAQADRPASDRFTAFIGSVIGSGTRPFRNRDSMGDFTKYAVAGLLSPSVKSASRIENLVAYIFDADVEVEQFIGMWLALEKSDQASLALGNCSLGVDALVGSSVYSVQDKFRIRIFARDLTQFEEFLPDGTHCERLVDAVYFYVGELLDYDIELAIPDRETRPVQLGRFGRLGWTSWMKDRKRDGLDTLRGDCRFHPAGRVVDKQKDTAQPHRQ